MSSMPGDMIPNLCAGMETEFQGKEVACPWPHSWQSELEHRSAWLQNLPQSVNGGNKAYKMPRTVSGMQ